MTIATTKEQIEITTEFGYCRVAIDNYDCCGAIEHLHVEEDFRGSGKAIELLNIANEQLIENYSMNTLMSYSRSEMANGMYNHLTGEELAAREDSVFFQVIENEFELIRIENN